MKVLIVCSKNSGRIAPFIVEQADSLSNVGVEIDYFCIEGKGFTGYLKNRKRLLEKLRQYKPDLIHAHYGLSGLLANTQRIIPVVTTYHGSDINVPRVFLLSRLNMLFSKHNIFVSEKMAPKSPKGDLRNKAKYSLIPCGVNTDLFVPMDKQEARKMLGFNDEKLVLFAGAFDIAVKNPELAKTASALVTDTRLIELKGYSREEVVILLNAVDVLLLTSFTEGSPQVIKEAMACNCPIVSVEVGDVRQVIHNTKGCFITTYNLNNVAEKLQQAISFVARTNGRSRIEEMGLDMNTVAAKVLRVYEKVEKSKLPC
ncbi:MAG: glycosyltransferase [Paludibacter sp.]|nr:glycosyltransferase [Paludibacter sp.]